jgi:nucleoside-diphosphate-sugar epimerase
MLWFVVIGVVVVIGLWAILGRKGRASLAGGSGSGATLRPPLIKPTPGLQVRTKKTGQTYLVTGGGGFLGSHIVEALLARGEDHIRVLDLRPSPIFDNESRVSFCKGDITKKEDVMKACEGVDVVFHTAALVDYWSRLAFQRPLLYKVNYQGTQNVIDACIAKGVSKLIFTSSSNAVFGANAEIRGQSEEQIPYPKRPVNIYAETKALGEKAVLAASGKNGLLTASLRPNGLFGPRDNIMADAIYRAGKPAELIASDNKQDWVYIENLVHAQLLAESKLTDGSPAAGEAFFIAGDKPMEYLQFWLRLNRALGGKDEDIKAIPGFVLYPLAHILEAITWLTRGKVKGEIFKLTPAVVQIARANIYLDTSKAKKLLGYEAPFTMEQAFQRVRQYYLGDSVDGSDQPKVKDIK